LRTPSQRSEQERRTRPTVTAWMCHDAGVWFGRWFVVDPLSLARPRLWFRLLRPRECHPQREFFLDRDTVTLPATPRWPPGLPNRSGRSRSARRGPVKGHRR
jgi:hypothetical protein